MSRSRYWKNAVRLSENLLKALSVLLMVCSIGGLCGWLIGASNSPVVAASLPLIFGIASAIGVERINLFRRVKAKDDNEKIVNEGQHALPLTRVPNRLVAYSFCATLFCAVCFGGILEGIKFRQQDYPLIKDLLPNGASLDADEVTALHLLKLSVRNSNLTTEEYSELMKDVFNPIFSDPKFVKGSELEEFRKHKVIGIVNQFRESLSGQTKRVGRGPASEGGSEIKSVGIEP